MYKSYLKSARRSLRGCLHGKHLHLVLNKILKTHSVDILLHRYCTLCFDSGFTDQRIVHNVVKLPTFKLFGKYGTYS